VAFYGWSMTINWLKVLTDVTITSNFPHVLDTFANFSGFVRNVYRATAEFSRKTETRAENKVKKRWKL
jgi:nitrogen fixation protein FixH